MTVPRALGAEPNDVEAFLALADEAPPADRYVLDMAAVGFVKPYGIVALVGAARRLSKLSGRPVSLVNLAEPVRMYLGRMDVFEVGADWLRPERTVSEGWLRSAHTPNLLELTTIDGPQDVAKAIVRAEHIFSRWLAVPNLNDLLRVLSELCANIYQHSGDPHGCVLIQKYEATSRGEAVVCLAVGDLGRGIRGSLVDRHGEIGQEPLDYLREALSGRTARDSGRGGLGLRLAEQIAGSADGYLWLRSENAALLSRQPGRARGRRALAWIGGTQAALELRAPMRV